MKCRSSRAGVQVPELTPHLHEADNSYSHIRLTFDSPCAVGHSVLRRALPPLSWQRTYMMKLRSRFVTLPLSRKLTLTTRIQDMTFDSTLQLYHYPCPCGDRFEISIDDLRDGEEIAMCPSCSLMIRVVFEVVGLSFDTGSGI